MGITGKLENIYMSILRHATLVGASIAIIAVLISAGLAVKGILLNEPIKPAETLISEREKDFKKDFLLNTYKADVLKASENKDGTKTSQEQPSTKEDPFRAVAEEDSKKIASIIANYYEQIDERVVDIDELNSVVLKLSSNHEIPNNAKGFYYETLLDVFNQIDKEIPSIKKIPKKAVDIQQIIEWHALKVREALIKINEENLNTTKTYQGQLQKYNTQKELTYQYLIAMAIAFALLISTILIFILARIEMHLRPPKEMAVSKKEVVAER